MSQTQIIICIQRHALPLHFLLHGGIRTHLVFLETMIRNHPLILPGPSFSHPVTKSCGCGFQNFSASHFLRSIPTPTATGWALSIFYLGCSSSLLSDPRLQPHPPRVPPPGSSSMLVREFSLQCQPGLSMPCSAPISEEPSNFKHVGLVHGAQGTFLEPPVPPLATPSSATLVLHACCALSSQAVPSAWNTFFFFFFKLAFIADSKTQLR